MTTVRRAFLLLATALALSTSACGTTYYAGSGIAKTEPRTVAGVKAISINLPGVVEVTQSDAESLSVTADDNILPLIETAMEDGVMKIRTVKSASINPRTKIRIALSVRTLESIAISGSGDVRCASLRSESLAVAISGSGDVVLAALDVKRFKGGISGSGDIRAAGTAETADFSIAGSGDVRAGKLQSARVSVSIAGSGDAEVWSTESLKVRVAGSGDVRYHGTPATVDRSIAGSGSVKPAGTSPS